MNQGRLSNQQEVTTNTPRAIVLALVVALHFMLLSNWLGHPVSHQTAINEMSISVAFAQPASRENHLPTPRTTAAVMPAAEQIADQPPPVERAAATVASTLPAVADSEPEFKAAYLNNPQPAYPLLARRNGLQGRVVLRVEVLAGGICGQINIHKSSGYAMLDNAALETVKTWRFIPARQAGIPVDKWFMIPVQFSLRDNAA